MIMMMSMMMMMMMMMMMIMIMIMMIMMLIMMFDDDHSYIYLLKTWDWMGRVHFTLRKSWFSLGNPPFIGPGSWVFMVPTTTSPGAWWRPPDVLGHGMMSHGKIDLVVIGATKTVGFQWGTKGDYTPWKLTWNLKMMVSSRNLLFQGFIFRFHVSFPGCNRLKTKMTLEKITMFHRRYIFKGVVFSLSC